MEKHQLDGKGKAQVDRFHEKYSRVRVAKRAHMQACLKESW